MLFKDNLGPHLSIDEVALTQGELYTVITNKAAKGKTGSLVAIVATTQSERVIAVLKKIPLEDRYKVEEITLDMAPTMEKIARKSFPKATQVTDRFHVQKLAYDALQDIRIKYRWEAIEQENNEIALAKQTGSTYKVHILDNGDTPKQLLARSRYLLFKAPNKWTAKQKFRAELLFERYPDLEQAYKLTRELASIYQKTKDKALAYTKLARWYDKIEKSTFSKSFGTVARSIQSHYRSILNFFDKRSTNASAESFNAKIKAFRLQFRGVRSIPFFLFRLSKIYA